MGLAGQWRGAAPPKWSFLLLAVAAGQRGSGFRVSVLPQPPVFGVSQILPWHKVDVWGTGDIMGDTVRCSLVPACATP